MVRASKVLVVLVAIALLLPIVCSAAPKPMDTLAAITGASRPAVTDWRYIGQDVPGAEKVEFDDSAWKVGGPDLTWGDDRIKIGWVRKKITLPDRLGAFALAGRVDLSIGVDDAGEVYVNGKFAQRFSWDQGLVMLTEDAHPGDTFVVAVKCINKGGPGRLLNAGLVLHLLNRIQGFVDDYRLAEAMCQFHAKAKGPLYETALTNCIAWLDLSAAERGDAAALLSSLEKAEAELKPFAEIAQQYTLHLIGHAHIDMNWLWLWPETVEVCQNTFTSMTNIMSENPDFTFSQSQPSTYVAVQETKPELFAKMRKYIKEGRWEITGGTWVEGDMNMASGESIVRQILYAKKYFRDTFGKEVDICWEPDTFGHAWSIPQILKKSGLKYYVFCRCGPGPRLFWWQGIDGSRVLAFNPHGYAGGVDAGLGRAAMEWADGINAKDFAHVYGAGDHGGGPTRASIAGVGQFQSRSVKPNLKFSTMDKFFESVQDRSDFPVVDKELNFTFQGCYTTHGDIKRMNRTSENLLPTAEAFSTIAGLYGGTYPSKAFRESWQRTCFNQFHDIFDGSAIHGAYDYSRGLFETTEKQASGELNASLRRIAGRIDTRGPGAPCVVFNPTSWNRTDIVVLDSPIANKTGQAYVVDSKGRRFPAQFVGKQIAFIARDVPSLGYSVYRLHSGRAAAGVKPGVSAKSAPDSCRMENEFLAVEVNRVTGAITGVYDKRAKRQVLAAAGGRLQALKEAPVGMSGWTMGEITDTTNISRADEVKIAEQGPVRSVIRVKSSHGGSRFQQDITLCAGVPRVDVRMTADWQEVGNPDKGSTTLKAAFAMDVKDGKATFEIPFAAIERKADGSEVPAQKWIDVSNGDYGVSLLNDCKYGHDVKDGEMRLTLLRSSYDPDPKPDQGVQEITYSLYPHSGDWRAAGTVRRAYELNNPLIPVRQSWHKGSLGATQSWVGVKPDNLIVTAFKRPEDGNGMILRFYECAGIPTKAQIRVPKGVKFWSETDLMERATGKPLRIGQNGISLPVGKYEIKTLLLR